MDTKNTVVIDLVMMLKFPVYYPPIQHNIDLRVAAKMPAAARLVGANDNEDSNV